ncbi:MAG TPA: zinc metalloprotease HtpX [Nitrospirota bacterium]|nr:zinc metalloprotease HtpX [Nitrospirota bacterium]
MPLTFIDIERQKNWRIWVFFLFLLLMYFIIAVVFTAGFLHVPGHAALRSWIFSGITALVVAGIHFWFSAYDTVGTVVHGLDARLPDLKDDIHKMLLNIMEEMHVVTGHQRKIQCVVIPSLSMNALSAADLKGEAVIGITEGLLSRLTRPQLETVVAHEAHHILSGDCLETTVASSLFGTYASALQKLNNTSSRGRAYSSPALLLTWSLLQLSYLLNMFISREREYRADAAAVRMTRNPIALAETLHLLSRSWRGAGFIGSGFEMLCIVNPQATVLDETEGFWADLLSTHPPLRKRMDILLTMAHTSIAELDAKAASRDKAAGQKTAGPQYYAMNPQQQWQGPFALGELGALAWLSPLTWVTTGEKQPVDRAWKQPLINDIFTARLSAQAPQAVTDLICPSCSQPLVAESYENTQVHQCRFCAGTLVENSRIARIIARTGRERPCSERINALTRAAVQENQIRYTKRMLMGGKNTASLLPCPKCKNSMSRGFYSSAHMIEVDRCSFCELTWFDRDELEMLQCLIENKIEPDLGL